MCVFWVAPKFITQLNEVIAHIVDFKKKKKTSFHVESAAVDEIQ